MPLAQQFALLLQHKEEEVKHQLLKLVRPIMFKLRSQEDINTAILRRGAEIAAKMTDKQIFTSPEFTRYATNLADFLLRNHRLYSLDIKYLPNPDAPIAYTDGKKIFLNAGNPIAAFPKLLERRFKANMGILMHEVAHKLFLDFRFKNNALDTICQGKLVGKLPQDPSVADDIAELEKAVSQPYYSAAIARIFANVENILSDGHDEAAIKRCFPGRIADWITVAGEVQMETANTLRELCDEDRDAYAIYSSLLLQYAKFGYYKEGEPNAFTAAYLEKMQEVEGIIDTALLSDDYAERWDAVNAVVVFLWPVLKKHFPEDPPMDTSSSGGSGASGAGGSGGSQGGQNGQGNSSQSGQQQSSGGQQQSDGGGSEGGSDQDDSSDPQQALQQLLDELAQAAQQAMNAAPAPVNGTDSGISEAEIQGTPDPAVGGLAGILQDLTQNQATKEIQKELDAAEMDMIRKCNMPMIHKKIHSRINQHMTPDRAEYDRIAKEIQPIAQNLIAQMKALFREMNESFVQHHRRFGPIVEATEAYRPDHKFFAKKKLPDDYPDMAICLLVDQSGSMWGEKIKAAQKTAILLEKFANGLGIPIMIAGHTTDGSEVVVNIFTDFISAKTAEARYSLGGMESLNCNRDGYAVRVCAELLSKRSEQVKLMISISDGAPNHDNYGGKEAMDDINQAVKEYRRKGLIIYGAAIDDDKDVIEEIYGKGFISIENLTALPKTLVRLVRQQLI